MRITRALHNFKEEWKYGLVSGMLAGFNEKVQTERPSSSPFSLGPASFFQGEKLIFLASLVSRKACHRIIAIPWLITHLPLSSTRLDAVYENTDQGNEDGILRRPHLIEIYRESTSPIFIPPLIVRSSCRAPHEER